MKETLARIGVAVGAAAALAGGIALANRALLLDDLPPTLPGQMVDWTWRGWRIRYTMLGTGSPLVLVHGIHAAASSFEVRNVFEPLSQRHTVYALDLLGFGKSERPPAPYSGGLYRDLLADFLVQVVGQPAVVVASSLGASFAVAAARQHPHLVARLVAISPTDTTRPGLLRRAAGALLGLPLIGTAAFNVLTSWTSIRWFLRRAYADPFLVDETLIGQHWATSHQPNARLAPAAFVAGRLDVPFETATAPVRASVLVVRGAAPGIGEQAGDDALRALGSDVVVETFEGVGQLPHDEAPDRFVKTLESWLAGAR